MKNNNHNIKVCYLCGKPIIDEKPTRDHIPPQQFFPKKIREDHNLNLWTAPTHRECNEEYREDEEYFYSIMFAAVAPNNPKMYREMFDDLMRRTNRPQTPAMMRRIMKETSSMSTGGIHLPPGRYQIHADQLRLERIVRKIARGLFWLTHNQFMPDGNCFDLRYCDPPEQVPVAYRIKLPDYPKGEYPKVFSYTHFDYDGQFFWVMCFWQAIIFCVAYNAPQLVITE